MQIRAHINWFSWRPNITSPKDFIYLLLKFPEGN